MVDGEGCANLLWGGIHQVELARVLEDLANTWIAPHGCDGLAYPYIEGLLGIRIDCILEQVVAELGIAWLLGGNVELSHGANEGFCAVDDVFVYSQAVHGELILRVAVLMYDLHLLDYGRLSAFSGACRAC